jgi:hypothetical protein
LEKSAVSLFEYIAFVDRNNGFPRALLCLFKSKFGDFSTRRFRDFPQSDKHIG